MPDMSPAEIALEIASSPETKAFLLGIAQEIAAEANAIADMTVGKLHTNKREGGRPIPADFGSDVTDTGDGARAHVWARNGTAIHAERKDGILAALADTYGSKHGDAKRQSGGKVRGRG